MGYSPWGRRVGHDFTFTFIDDLQYYILFRSSVFFKKYLQLFVYFCLCCRVGSSLVAACGGTLVDVHGLLTAVPALLVEHGLFRSCGTWT